MRFLFKIICHALVVGPGVLLGILTRGSSIYEGAKLERIALLGLIYKSSIERYTNGKLGRISVLFTKRLNSNIFILIFSSILFLVEKKNNINQALKLICKQNRQCPIVIVFGLGSFGDVLQAIPLLNALKTKFPKASLILIHNDQVGEKLLSFSNLIAKYIRLPSAEHALFKSYLMQKDYDLLVDLNYIVKYTISKQARFNENERLFIEKAQEAQAPWLNFIKNFPHDNDQMWRAAKNLNWSMYDLMAQTSGFSNTDFEDFLLDIPKSNDLSKKFNLPKNYLIVCNAAEWLSIQSSEWTKCLPHAHMREVLRQIKALTIPTVLLGSSNDPGDYQVDFDLRGKTNLLEVAEIIRGARLMLGPEGGLVNLAKAVGTQSIVFFGSTPADFFKFESNINIEPEFCGGCWWTTQNYLKQCPLLESIPPCTLSIDPSRIVNAIKENYKTEEFAHAS